MVECEGCGDWAHIECLQRSGEVDALRPVEEATAHYRCRECVADVAKRAPGSGGRTQRSRRVRKANSRYKADFVDDHEDPGGAGAGGAGGMRRCESGGSQHSSRSSRDKTNEASTLLLGLSKGGGGGGGGGPAGGGGGAAAGGIAAPTARVVKREPLSRPRSAGPAAAPVPAAGTSAADDASNQLELFLSNGLPPGARHRSAVHLAPAIAAQDLMRNHPGRTASPGAAALTAAAAVAMKHHEMECMQRSGSADIPPLMPNDPFAALFPAISAGKDGAAAALLRDGLSGLSGHRMSGGHETLQAPK
eukprot:160209-Chlamydomonas_euryale.AAC.1